jgi:hypothetical protein
MATPSVESIRPLRRVEYDQLIALGAFQDERIELLDGVLVRMSPIGSPHCATVDRLTELLVLALAGKALIRVQGAFAAGEFSEPEPDLIVLPRADYDSGHPDRAYLIIEVAESSLARDRGRKARLYAECGVPEYWVVNLQDRRVEVHRAPAAGVYQEATVIEHNGALRLTEFPEVELRVSDFLK